MRVSLIGRAVAGASAGSVMASTARANASSSSSVASTPVRDGGSGSANTSSVRHDVAQARTRRALGEFEGLVLRQVSPRLPCRDWPSESGCRAGCR